MTVVQINVTCDKGSTGRICAAVSRLLDGAGVENYILHADGSAAHPSGSAAHPSGSAEHPRGIAYTNRREIKMQALASRVRGNYGFNSRQATHRLLRLLDTLSPDVVHLHNLHGHNLHLGMLLSYLRKRRIKTFWTFHDCWAFTAYCPYYDAVGCDQWKTECRKCPSWRRYSWFFDRSRRLFHQKREAVKDLDLTVVAPSLWIAEQAKSSFFENYPIRVIRNGIDLGVFCPTESHIRQRYNLTEYRVLLGAAYKWSARKGLDVFGALAGALDDSYRIILVGVTEEQKKQLPPSVICLPRVHDPKELAALYTAADVFINPTREETLGLTNIEALACGTPVITFDRGGSPECVDETCGAVVPCDDIPALVDAIHRVTREHAFSPEACRAYASRFNAEDAFGEYVKLYGIAYESTATETI